MSDKAPPATPAAAPAAPKALSFLKKLLPSLPSANQFSFAIIGVVIGIGGTMAAYHLRPHLVIPAADPPKVEAPVTLRLDGLKSLIEERCPEPRKPALKRAAQ